MELYGKQHRSIPQKTIIHVLELALLWLSFWILFQSGSEHAARSFGLAVSPDNGLRRQIIFAFNLVIFFRMSYTLFGLLKRYIPWEECFSIPMAFALYYVGFSILVLPARAPVGALDYFAMVLFLTGCILNTGGEMLRKIWKEQPENKGRIYTGGFFQYARHINYFGDLLWVSGYAIITRNNYSVLIVIFLFSFFAFYNAPKLDQYLEKKYGDAYRQYAAKTKMLIPFIY